MKLPKLLSVLTVACAAVFTTSETSAQSVTPNPAPTVITTAPYTISQPGYYQLGKDLIYGGTGATNDAIITINASNVTLDFGGHYISGPSNNAASTLYGIYASERGNLNIQNGTIAFCSYGIYLTGNGSSTTLNINQRIQNMLVSYCLSEGILAVNSSNSTATNCRISFIGGSSNQNYAVGLYFSSGAGNQIANTTVTNVTGTGGGGFGLAGNNNTLMANCVVSNVTDSKITTEGYGLYGASAALTNTLTNCYYGVFSSLKYRDNVTISCHTPFSGGGTDAGGNN